MRNEVAPGLETAYALEVEYLKPCFETASTLEENYAAVRMLSFVGYGVVD